MRKLIGPENSSLCVNRVPPDSVGFIWKPCKPAIKPKTGGPCHRNWCSEFSWNLYHQWDDAPYPLLGIVSAYLDLSSELHPIDLAVHFIAWLQLDERLGRVLCLKQLEKPFVPFRIFVKIQQLNRNKRRRQMSQIAVAKS